MGLLSKLGNLFSSSGRDDNLLLQGLEHAKADRPQKAIEIYDAVLKSPGASGSVRSRALFNRALAYSALKDDAQAVADLEAVLETDGAPENVLTATRTQLIRVRKRLERRG